MKPMTKHLPTRSTQRQPAPTMFRRLLVEEQSVQTLGRITLNDAVELELCTGASPQWVAELLIALGAR